MSTQDAPAFTDAHEEMLLALAYDELEDDPAELLDILRRSPAGRDRLEALIRETQDLRSAMNLDPNSSPAVGRLKAILVEVQPLSAVPGGASAPVQPREAAPSNVRSLAAVRERKNQWVIPVMFAVAAGLAVVIYLGIPSPKVPAAGGKQPAARVAQLDAETGLSLAEQVGEAMGFGGQKALPAYQVGWLSSAVADLAHLGAADTRVMAYVDRLLGRDGPTEPAARLKAATKGCAVLSPGEALTVCEHGAFAYRLFRDLTVGERDRAVEWLRSPDARAYLKWAQTTMKGDLADAARTLEAGFGRTTRKYEDLWRELIADPTVVQ